MIQHRSLILEVREKVIKEVFRPGTGSARAQPDWCRKIAIRVKTYSQQAKRCQHLGAQVSPVRLSHNTKKAKGLKTKGVLDFGLLTFAINVVLGRQHLLARRFLAL